MFRLKIFVESKLSGGGPPCPRATSATLLANQFFSFQFGIGNGEEGLKRPYTILYNCSHCQIRLLNYLFRLLSSFILCGFVFQGCLGHFFGSSWCLWDIHISIYISTQGQARANEVEVLEDINNFIFHQIIVFKKSVLDKFALGRLLLAGWVCWSPSCSAWSTSSTWSTTTHPASRWQTLQIDSISTSLG